MTDIEKHWTKIAIINLVGKKIIGARYLTREEVNEMGWFHRPLALMLEDGTFIYSSRDDEGNDGGALFTTNPKVDGFPVIAEYLD